MAKVLRLLTWVALAIVGVLAAAAGVSVIASTGADDQTGVRGTRATTGLLEWQGLPALGERAESEAVARPEPAADPERILAVTTVGGTAAFSAVDGRVTLLWASPAPGFRLEMDGSPDLIEFEGAGHRSRIEIEFDRAAGLRSYTAEEARTMSK